MATPRILCFGEVLLDILPDGEWPGGSPLNVAYHLRRLGRASGVISAIGEDARGNRLRTQLDEWGISTAFLKTLTRRSTGVVNIKLNNGIPSYRIETDAAWDHLAGPPPSPDADVLVFASLAQRSDANRKALDAWLAALPGAMRVFDANLRFPFVDRERILILARRASVLKVNNEEADYLLQAQIATAEPERAAQCVSKLCGGIDVCITMGARGAGLLRGAHWCFEAAPCVDVVDTVGAGDAFLAAMIDGLLPGDEYGPSQMLRRACRLASFVATRRGATPAYSLPGDGAPEAPLDCG